MKKHPEEIIKELINLKRRGDTGNDTVKTFLKNYFNPNEFKLVMNHLIRCYINSNKLIPLIELSLEKADNILKDYANKNDIRTESVLRKIIELKDNIDFKLFIQFIENYWEQHPPKLDDFMIIHNNFETFSESPIKTENRLENEFSEKQSFLENLEEVNQSIEYCQTWIKTRTSEDRLNHYKTLPDDVRIRREGWNNERLEYDQMLLKQKQTEKKLIEERLKSYDS